MMKIKVKEKKTGFLNILLLVSLLFFLALTFVLNFKTTSCQHFSYLASSFLQGKLYFTEKPLNYIDSSFYQGHYYWSAGLFPALLLLPFVWLSGFFGAFFLQGFVQPFLVAVVFLLCLKIAKKIGYDFEEALFWGFAFCFGSVFLNVALVAWSYWFSQVVTVLLLWLAIDEYLNRRRYWLIGFYFSLVLATRATAFIGITFFVLDLLLAKNRVGREKLRSSIQLCGFPVLALLLLLIYNYLRFGSVWETGYNLQWVYTLSLKETRSAGLFSLAHLPANLYYFFLSTPLPVFKDGVSKVLSFPYLRSNPWGMSVFITSPYFLYLVFAGSRKRRAKYIWASVILTAFCVFCYYGIGFIQYGYRYALDFLPFIYWLLMFAYREREQQLSLRFKILLLVSGFMNLFWFVRLLWE